MPTVLFGLAGAAAGCGLAVLLRRVGRGCFQPFGFLLRLLLVGGVLIMAAMSGSLPAAVAGWAGGFALGCAHATRRMR